ncbi:LPS assembly lipoprotein LptE [Ancylobacter sp. WKF20]|uniref:LPS assembly lipoprotein LptE n=1 Tax=Ancylobacter sp. WKF20 TaxID=3039801 RepID=UPI0024344F55|nr:LPS assembly lipoprotein LptE [Ancylobacter sp. WKF20]WGD29259.1 LPS assembly lipoprotein LptE [Ancylobacter sp. WKF20]
MSSLDRTRLPSRRRLLGLACAGLLALSTAGCFRPMYAEDTGDGSKLSDKFGQIEIVFAPGRVGNEVRNDLIFDLTGGAGNPAGAPYQLILQVNDSSVAAVVDPYTGLPEVELVSVDVNWQLIDTTKPVKAGAKPTPVTTGTAFGKASIDSGYQRFARERALRDAQNRASRVAAEMIRGQLASYFIAPPPKS